jgi:hypothetical protein
MIVTPSFERIDYSIRTNKNIERKLVFERLQTIRKAFDLHKYRYLGLGSMWFVDFGLAHRALNIQELWSFETTGPARAEFNKPFNCVEVRPGTTGEGLAGIDADHWLKPTLVWFDYDGPFTADVAADCRRLLLNLVPGSLVIITVNANRRNYKASSAADEGPPVVARLNNLFGAAVPVGAREAKPDIDEGTFPTVLRDSVLAFLTNIVRTSGRVQAGKPIRFIPLFDLLHVDGTPMMTAGGMVVSDDDLVALASALDLTISEVLAGKGLIRRTIDLIPITVKEKIALDALLPCAEEDFAAKYEASGLKLDVSQAMKYRELYSYFPVFAETLS